MARLYVVTDPPSARGIYETWGACRDAVAGVPGARYQSVDSRDEAEAMLSGEGVILPAGRYAFVDGNHLGGVGVVLVTKLPASAPPGSGDRPDHGPADAGGDGVVDERASTVYEVFAEARLPGLTTRTEITQAMNRLRNVLAELAGLYLALTLTPPSVPLVVVHDYEGVGAWMEGRWKARDPMVARVVTACRDRARAQDLAVSFRRQRGHAASWAGRNDFARYNARADALATEAALAGW